MFSIPFQDGIGVRGNRVGGAYTEIYIAIVFGFKSVEQAVDVICGFCFLRREVFGTIQMWMDKA